MGTEREEIGEKRILLSRLVCISRLQDRLASNTRDSDMTVYLLLGRRRKPSTLLDNSLKDDMRESRFYCGECRPMCVSGCLDRIKINIRGSSTGHQGQGHAKSSRMLLSPIRSSTFLRPMRSRNLLFYHSSNHPPSPSYTPLQHKILSTSLSLVPSTGFTSETLTEGAKQAGYLEITHNLFPRGPWSIVEYHLVRQREALASIPLARRRSR